MTEKHTLCASHDETPARRAIRVLFEKSFEAMVPEIIQPIANSLERREDGIYKQTAVEALWIGFRAALNGEVPSLVSESTASTELERAYQMLECFGVPRARAKNVPNGIDVLGTRVNREASALGALERDAARYRFLRGEEVATDPRYYPFWNEFNAKLCREEKLDHLIDTTMRAACAVPAKP